MDLKKLSVYLVLLVSVLAAACIKDRTAVNVTPINPIKIDTAGIPLSFVVFQLDTLSLSPKVVKEGFNSEQLKYEWTMNAYQGYKRVIGTQRALIGQITEAPSSTAYTLILTVTDTTTNLKAFFTWSVSVLSRFSEGLIVADTKDGLNSDVSLIMANNFTGSFLDEKATKIHRNLFSSINSDRINGLVKGLSYMNYNNAKYITLLTENSYVRLDPNSYKLVQKDQDLFIIAPDVLKPDAIQSIQLINQHEYIINNGKAYGRYGGTLQFIYPFLGDPKGYMCKKICGLQQPPSNSAGVVYDELNNRFLLLPTMTSSTAPITSYPAVDNSNPTPAFDPNNVGNKTCLFMQEGYNKRVLSVMKTRDFNQYYAYQLVVGPVSGKMGYAMHDLSNNPEINLSKFYACSSGEEVLFYATDTKVYSTTLLVGGNTSPNLRYTTESGEKITGMQMHIRGGTMYLPSLTAPNDYDQKLSMSSANRLVVLSTYNEATKIGKIIAIPLQTLGVGGLVSDPAYIKTYTGFGKITAFNFQGL
jgi:hypothetical protein